MEICRLKIAKWNYHCKKFASWFHHGGTGRLRCDLNFILLYSVFLCWPYLDRDCYYLMCFLFWWLSLWLIWKQAFNSIWFMSCSQISLDLSDTMLDCQLLRKHCFMTHVFLRPARLMFEPEIWCHGYHLIHLSRFQFYEQRWTEVMECFELVHWSSTSLTNHWVNY